MIFAELGYTQHYSDMHDRLLQCMQRNFSQVESGLQGDSWIWILEGDEKVAIDTFSSMKHQIKACSPESHLVGLVIKALSTEFDVTVYPEPDYEGHE